ncbi:MAG: signal peptide peptidase SppA [Deferribacteres bacterium]|nr:signal peptide peptidase SppA [candidate division KSB1 bacterium]MCB9501500.1 signal peptide peptidase SppA [Deferribacteres bacterium]
MKRLSEKIVIALLFVAILVFLYSVITELFFDSAPSIAVSKNKIGLIEVKGVIIDSEKTVERIQDFQDNSSIQGLIVRINSPGGGVAASQEIYEALQSYRRDTGKPVVASMASVAASGGYYVACGVDTIVANPGTTTGSIGVIMELMDYSVLLQKIGVEVNVVQSGRFKDSGRGSRKLTKDDKAYFQQFIDDAYSQFLDVVADARNMDKSQVKKLADGRVYTGQQALANGLVDKLGTYSDAVNLVARMAGIEDQPVLVRPYVHKRTFFDLLFGDLEDLAQEFTSLPVLRYQLVY